MICNFRIDELTRVVFVAVGYIQVEGATFPEVLEQLDGFYERYKR